MLTKVMVKLWTILISVIACSGFIWGAPSGERGISEDTEVCTRFPTTTSHKLNAGILRKIENHLFNKPRKSSPLCAQDVQDLIRVLRFQYEQTESRLDGPHVDTMSRIRWIDELSLLKCRVQDLFDRAEMVSVLALKHPRIANYLSNKKREQNKLCTDNLRNELLATVDEKLTRDQRGASAFLWYNINANKPIDAKLFLTVPMQDFYVGAHEYLIPRGYKKIAKKFMFHKRKLEPEEEEKYYELEFHRLLDDACEAVHSNLLKYLDYFENLMLISDLPEISINARVLEWMSIIRVCEIIVKKDYSFDLVYDPSLQPEPDSQPLEGQEQKQQPPQNGEPEVGLQERTR